jgi:hypothetical protein
MADDLDAELSALEDKAPLTIDAEPDEYGPGNPAPEEGDGEPTEAKEAKEAKDDKEPKENGEADDWKPPTKDHWENIQKAQRAEREARREAERQARLYEQNIERMQQGFEQYRLQQMQQQLQAPPPDPYENPDAARAWQQQRQQQLQQLWQAEQQRQQQLAQEQEQERQFRYVAKTVEDFETEFKTQNPDYDDATEHMLGVQQKLLEGMGYPKNVAEQQVAMWSLNVAQQAVQTGRNPAQVAYELAKQMGYQPKGSGVQAAAEKLAAMKAGQDSAKTLSGGGMGGSGRPDLKAIGRLEGAAFDAAFEKYLSDSIRGR